MASRASRFRRDRAPEALQPAGDLFEHYGIHLDPAPFTVPVPVVTASPCRQCGWYVSEALSSPCPVCAEPHPLKSSPPAKQT